MSISNDGINIRECILADPILSNKYKIVPSKNLTSISVVVKAKGVHEEFFRVESISDAPPKGTCIPLEELKNGDINIYHYNGEFYYCLGGRGYRYKMPKFCQGGEFYKQIIDKILELDSNADFQRNAVKISNVAEYLEAISKYGKKAQFFRGISRETFTLIPTIYRQEEYAENEFRMYREFKNAFINELDNKTHIECLTIMQHYGLPTRLLDITTNPLVALFMVCNQVFNDPKLDDYMGEVILFDDPKIKYADSHKVEVLAALPLLSKKEKDLLLYELKDKTEKIILNQLSSDAQMVIEKLEWEIQRDNPSFTFNFDDLSFLKQAFIVKVGMITNRIIVQNGAFIILGVDKDYIEKNMRNIKFRILITNKKKIREELKMLGFSDKTMIPEMEYLSKFLREEYGKKV